MGKKTRLLKRTFRTVKKGYGTFMSGVQRANVVALKVSAKARQLEKRVVTPEELIFGSQPMSEINMGSPSDYIMGSNRSQRRRRR